MAKLVTQGLRRFFEVKGNQANRHQYLESRQSEGNNVITRPNAIPYTLRSCNKIENYVWNGHFLNSGM